MGKKNKGNNLEDENLSDNQQECCKDAEHCHCGDACECDDECNCSSECNCHDEACQQGCDCHEEGCECDDQCDCEECQCDEDTQCQHDSCQCGQDDQNLAGEYLAMAQRLQADFDNYRKRVTEQLDRERQEGVKSVVEVFLPCLDAFKEAKKSVKEEGTLAGINMIEEKILNAFASLKVEKIDAVGQKFDPHLHNVIAVLSDAEKEDDVILEEYQSGWTLNGKVIRYSKVVVNKKP